MKIKLLALILTVLMVPDAHAVLISPTADGTVFDGAQGPFDGVGDYVNTVDYPQAFKLTSFESRALWEYDLSGVTDPVADAVMNLTVDSQIVNPSFTLDLYTYNADGVISVSDYASGTHFGSTTYSGEGSLSLDVTSVLQDAQNNNQSMVGFNFRKLESDLTAPGQPYVAFNSLNHPPAATLAVNEKTAAVPEPMTLVLFSVGSLAAFALKGNRKKILDNK